MSGTNGNKRPFGPHGEGCTCDPDDARSPEEAHPPEESEMNLREDAPQMISLQPNFAHPIEVIMNAVSEAYATHFIAAADTCAMDGCPLSGRQLTHLMAALMQGHALARESAQIIIANYMRMAAIQRAEEEKAKETESPKAVLHDLSELFHRKPEPESDGPDAA